ncbi:alpha/beta fold hydrolase [Streptomyces xiamenensis]|uniref:alpha/beta fold hydrolase n=1 Tax=Streptomyces xiamenensis TaxID=408015 RepID=UPI0036EE0378
MAWTAPGLDSGGDGIPLLALHGSFGRGAIFARLAADLGPAFRVLAPDQRGHGHCPPRPGGFGVERFTDDAERLLTDLVQERGGRPVAVLGHSLGGIIAYHLAARRPDLVSALVIEDVGPVMRRPEIERPVLDVRGWPATAPTREALAAAIEAAGVPDATYFMASAVPDEERGGWRLLFDWDTMTEVQAGGVGDWWPRWLGSRCPALVLRGGHSTLLPAPLARGMTARRPGAHLLEFPAAGHWIHDDDPVGVAEAVRAFLTP